MLLNGSISSHTNSEFQTVGNCYNTQIHKINNSDKYHPIYPVITLYLSSVQKNNKVLNKLVASTTNIKTCFVTFLHMLGSNDLAAIQQKQTEAGLEMVELVKQHSRIKNLRTDTVENKLNSKTWRTIESMTKHPKYIPQSTEIKEDKILRSVAYEYSLALAAKIINKDYGHTVTNEAVISGHWYNTAAYIYSLLTDDKELRDKLTLPREIKMYIDAHEFYTKTLWPRYARGAVLLISSPEFSDELFEKFKLQTSDQPQKIHTLKTVDLLEQTTSLEEKEALRSKLKEEGKSNIVEQTVWQFENEPIKHDPGHCTLMDLFEPMDIYTTLSGSNPQRLGISDGKNTVYEYKANTGLFKKLKSSLHNLIFTQEEEHKELIKQMHEYFQYFYTVKPSSSSTLLPEDNWSINSQDDQLSMDDVDLAGDVAIIQMENMDTHPKEEIKPNISSEDKMISDGHNNHTNSLIFKSDENNDVKAKEVNQEDKSSGLISEDDYLNILAQISEHAKALMQEGSQNQDESYNQNDSMDTVSKPIVRPTLNRRLGSQDLNNPTKSHYLPGNSLNTKEPDLLWEEIYKKEIPVEALER